MIASCSGGGLETGNSEEEDDAPAVISDFIYQGASLHNQTDRTGETALHLAARYSRSDAAKRLLEASADANIQDNMGRTPLHAAVSADAQGVFQVKGSFHHCFSAESVCQRCGSVGTVGSLIQWVATSLQQGLGLDGLQGPFQPDRYGSVTPPKKGLRALHVSEVCPT